MPTATTAKTASKTTEKAAKTIEKPKAAEKVIEKAPEKVGKPVPVPVSYEGFLAKLTAMMSMAPHSAKANGQQSMQFYIQDGKYRMQIFALEDLRDGSIHVYVTDAVDEATKAGVFGKSKPSDEPNELRLPGSTDTLNVERLDGKVSNPAPFYKDMLGWNRRAAHITLPVMASDAQADAAEKLLVLGAKKAGAIA
jgi:hypothetical protein